MNIFDDMRADLASDGSHEKEVAREVRVAELSQRYALWRARLTGMNPVRASAGAAGILGLQPGMDVNYPHLLPAGQRDVELRILARKARMIARSSSLFYVGDGGVYGFPPMLSSPVHRAIWSLLVERVRMTVDVDWSNRSQMDMLETLLRTDPARFSDSDFEVVVRSLWKRDRGVGFTSMGGMEALRCGLIPSMIEHWDNRVIAPATKRFVSWTETSTAVHQCVPDVAQSPRL